MRYAVRNLQNGRTPVKHTLQLLFWDYGRIWVRCGPMQVRIRWRIPITYTLNLWVTNLCLEYFDTTVRHRRVTKIAFIFERIDIDISAVEDNFIDADKWKLCCTTHAKDTSFRRFFFFLLKSPYLSKQQPKQRNKNRETKPSFINSKLIKIVIIFQRLP